LINAFKNTFQCLCLRQKFTGISIIVNGVTYKSIADAAKNLGISSEPFRLRIKDGMTPDEALQRARKK
jgi:TPP-dependent indolepyruvate ferredoxin oxidoreductase alpha subunit